MRKNKLLLLLALLLTAVTGAWAEEQVVYTLDGTQTANNTAYTTAGVVNQGGMTWMVTGNTSMNPWRIGGKNLSGVDRSVWSESSLDETVTKVTLEFGTASSITVNSITMTVAGDDGFSDVIDTKAVTFSANNTVDVTPTEGKEWKNAYYRFVFNVTVSGSSNNYFQLKSIKFYNDPDAQQQGGSTEPVAGTFTVTMKDGTVDAKNWSIASGEKSAKGDAADGLTGLSEGDQVTLTYTGRLKVKGVKATSEAVPAKPALTLGEMTQGGDPLNNGSGSETYFSPTFSEGQQVAVFYKNTSGQTVKVLSDALTASDISNEGKSATINVTIDDADKTQPVTYFYPATMAKDDGSINFNFTAQSGTEASLSTVRNCYKGSGAWDGNALPSVSMASQIAIWKLTMTGGNGMIMAQKVTVKVGGNKVAEASASGVYFAYPIDIYLALNPATMGTGTLRIEADEFGTIYYYQKDGGVSLTAGKFYQSAVELKR